MFGSVRGSAANRTLIDLFGSARTVKHHFGRSLVKSSGILNANIDLEEELTAVLEFLQ